MILQRVIDFSLRQKYVALALVVIIGFGSFRRYSRIPINSLPDVTPVQVLVITKAGRYSPFDVRKAGQLSHRNRDERTAGCERSSLPSSGSRCNVLSGRCGYLFCPADDQSAVAKYRGELPAGVFRATNSVPFPTALGEIYQCRSAADTRRHGTAHDTGWLIAATARNRKGVTEINSFGGFVKQYDVIVMPGKLRTHGISLKRSDGRHRRHASVSGGGFLESQSRAIHHSRIPGQSATRPISNKLP